jgi:hypothetical protein
MCAIRRPGSVTSATQRRSLPVLLSAGGNERTSMTWPLPGQTAAVPSGTPLSANNGLVVHWWGNCQICKGVARGVALYGTGNNCLSVPVGLTLDARG